jgi:alpha-mannosidase
LQSSPIDLTTSITWSLGEQERFEYLIAEDAVAGTEYELYIETACNGISGVGDGSMVPDPNRYYSVAVADLVVRNQVAFDLYYDMM